MTNLIPPKVGSIDCSSCPLRELDCFVEFESEKITRVKEFKIGELHIEKGATLLEENSNTFYLYTILSGWCFRYKTMEDGRRQILNFSLPGDLVGLQANLLEEVEHSIEAASDVRLCVFDRSQLWDLYRDEPEISYSLTWNAAKEERFLDENLLSVGRRKAIESVAYLLLSLFERAESLSLDKKGKIDFPITQDLIADALGLTPEHTNKMINQLKKMSLLKWKDKQLEILDRKGIAELAGYTLREFPKRYLL